MTISSNAAFCLAFAIVAAAFPIASAAQNCTGPSCSASSPSGNACRVSFDSASGSGIYDGAQSAEPAGCYSPGAAYGLQGWRFHAEGDQELTSIELTHSNDGIEFAFADVDGGEGMHGFAWLVPLPDGSEVKSVVASGCAGICRVSLGQVPSNQAVVLVGFSFDRGNNDGRLHNLAVGPVLRSPSGVAALTMDFRDEAEFSYRAEIQYALVPTDALSGAFEAGASYSGGGAALVGLTNVGDALLSGFSFRFDAGSRVLEDVGLAMSGLGYEVWFQDKQGEAEWRRPDDAFSWEAEYVILN